MKHGWPDEHLVSFLPSSNSFSSWLPHFLPVVGQQMTPEGKPSLPTPVQLVSPSVCPILYTCITEPTMSFSIIILICNPKYTGSYVRTRIASYSASQPQCTQQFHTCLASLPSLTSRYESTSPLPPSLSQPVFKHLSPLMGSFVLLFYCLLPTPTPMSLVLRTVAEV